MTINTGVDVIAYQPLKIKTEEYGHVASVYRVALLVVAGKSYLIDEFGVGTNDLNDIGGYNMPVFSINPEDDISPNFRDPIVGTFPLNQETLKYLQMDSPKDLAQFIRSDCAPRLERWVAFVREEQNRATA